MANKHRGEVTARLDGKDYTLCLTLGALAELDAFVLLQPASTDTAFSAGDARKLALLVVVATIPTGLIGLLGKEPKFTNAVIEAGRGRFCAGLYVRRSGQWHQRGAYQLTTMESLCDQILQIRNLTFRSQYEQF